MLEAVTQLAEDPAQLLAGNMEQRRVGEDPVVAIPLQRQVQEVLVEHWAARLLPRHLAKACAAVQAHGLVPKRREMEQIAPRSAAEIEQRERSRSLDVRKQGSVVLT